MDSNNEDIKNETIDDSNYTDSSIKEIFDKSIEDNLLKNINTYLTRAKEVDNCYKEALTLNQVEVAAKYYIKVLKSFTIL